MDQFPAPGVVQPVAIEGQAFGERFRGGLTGVAAVTVGFSLLAFGPVWLRFAVVCLCALVPLSALAAAAAARADRCLLDDGAGRIVKGFFKIPYADVAAVIVLERLGTLQVSVRVRRSYTVRILESCAAERRETLARLLGERLPGVPVRWVRIPPWTAAIAPALLLAAYGFFAVHVRRISPEIRVRPERRELAAAAVPPLERYEFAGTAFFLPAGFSVVRTGEAHIALVWEETGARVYCRRGLYGDFLARAHPNTRVVLRELFGVRNGYEMLRWIYGADYGLLPLVFKALALRELRDVRIWDLAGPGPRGLVMIGRGMRGEDAEIVLLDPGSGRELTFSVRDSPARTEELAGMLRASFLPRA